MKKFFKKIKYLFEYLLVLTIIQIMGLFGISKSVNICRYLARIIGPILPVNKIAEKNLKNIFGKDFAYKAIIDQIWDNFGSFIGEIPYINKMSNEELSERVEIIGIERIKELQDAHQPFLLFTGHFANWDFALKIIDKFFPKFAIIYRKANNPYVDKLIIGARRSSNIKLIPKGTKGARDLISAIKSGYAIGMLVDQKMNDGIEVPFLGRPAMTANAIAKIALQFDYPIIPLQVIRTNTDSHFKVIIHQPLKFNRTNDIKLDCYNIMVIINQILGNWVKEHPGQWFWFHNRWKKNFTEVS
jgi:KDO2-lipid IV(A) lauroyltransferase